MACTWDESSTLPEDPFLAHRRGAGAGTRVAVNGRALPEAPEPGAFHRIARTWASRAQLLAANQVSRGSSDWSVEAAGGRTSFRTFGAIADEKYRLYHEVTG